MKSERGITLTSLGIYIVVILLVLITLSTITTYFRSNVNEFNTKTSVDLEFDKFNLYFIGEVKKTNNEIVEENSNETKVVFTSGNTYEFIENSIILNENIKIAEKIDACTFTFKKNEKNIQSVTVYMKVGETERTNEYSLSNKVLENTDNEDYVYGYKRVDGTSELNLTNSLATNLKGYKIYGNSIQNGEPTPTSPVEIKSVGDKTVNLVQIPNTTVSGSGSWTAKNLGDFELAAGTYTISANYKKTGEDQPDIQLSIREYGASTPYYGEATGVSAEGYLTVKFTVPEGSKGIRLYAYSNVTATKYNSSCDFFNIQIQEGDIATAYEPYGKYKIPVVVKGTNLFDKNDTAYGQNKFWSIETGKLSTDYTYYASPKIPIKENTSYIRTDTTTQANIFWDAEGNLLSYVLTGQSFTTPSGACYVGFNIPNTMSPSEVQLNEGTSLLDYQPYFRTNIYLDEPLRKVGDYADYIDFENQKVVRKIKYREFSENDNWSKYESVDKHFQVGVGDNYFETGKQIVMSNYYPTAIQKNAYSEHSLEYAVLSVDGSRIRFKNKDCSTVDEWKTWITGLGENLYVIYGLAIPTEEPIELPAIPTYEGLTTVTIDTEIPPSNTEVVYYSK